MRKKQSSPSAPKRNYTSDPRIIAVAWPYANGDLHLGHPAGYLLAADVMNRYQRIRGRDVIMISGSDMHGTPIAVKAFEKKKDPKEFAAAQHERHVRVMELLGLQYSLYTSTATSLHQELVQLIFKSLDQKGYISKQRTEAFWSEKEHKFLLDRYIEGKCPHCGYEGARGDQCDNCGRTLTPDELIKPYSIFGDKELVKRASTNYYLNLDKLQPLLDKHFSIHPGLKEWRKHVWATTKSWLDEGLQPRAITRDMEGYGVQLPLGYEIPGEEGKVIYVWFEAVCGYFTASVELSMRQDKFEGMMSSELLSAISSVTSTPEADAKISSNTYAGQELNWQKYWLNPKTKSYYFMGKDNIPFHAIIWTAMLLGLNDGEDIRFNLPWNIPACQYLNLKGGKFSKSKGNVIDTREFVQKYGLDTVRYFLISRMPENKDYDFTWTEFVDANNNELLANVGNLVNRTLVFWNKFFAAETGLKTDESRLNQELQQAIANAYEKAATAIEACRFAEGFNAVLELASVGNKYFNDSAIWRMIKTDKEKAGEIMVNLLQLLANLAVLLHPFLPEMSGNIRQFLGEAELTPEVGQDHWQRFSFAVDRLGEISGLRPLVAKLELEVVLADEGEFDGKS